MAGKALIFGTGYIGQHLFRAFQNAGIETTIERFALACDSAERFRKFDWVVNATGFCGYANVSDCEQPRLKDKTFYSNTIIPTHIARDCLDAKATMVQISSGCFWQHQSDVSGFPTIQSTYVQSKWQAERAIEEICDQSRSFIVRIRMPFDNIDCRRNVLSKLISYPKIWGTNPFSMSCMPEMADSIAKAMLKGVSGTHNFVNQGSITNQEIAMMIYGEFGLHKEIDHSVISSDRSFVTIKPSEYCKDDSDVKHAVKKCLQHWRWR